jgi:hypothetical protein
MNYQLCCRYRQWIGKPDPSGFGTFNVASKDLAWLQSYGQELTLKGHTILRIQKQVGEKWVTI